MLTCALTLGLAQSTFLSTRTSVPSNSPLQGPTPTAPHLLLFPVLDPYGTFPISGVTHDQDV